MKNVVLGIDTSNYTTSLSILSEDGELIANLKRPLTVKAGERGLRQSEAVFAHTKNIPELMREAGSYLTDKNLICLGVSERPRNIEGSYMPCFLSGVAVAESISSVLGVPLYRFSHQCGHIMSALYSAGKIEELSKAPFAAFHVSGGTTEMLRVSFVGDGFSAELLGGAADLNAGQVIDRIGVLMGLSFPAGRELEALALQNTKKIPKKQIKLQGLSLNLSGLENMAAKLYTETEDKPLVAAFVLDYIGRGLLLLAEAYTEKYGKAPFVFAGGVMSNSIIKKMLSEKLDAYFAEPQMSADNAVGIARLALGRYRTKI